MRIEIETHDPRLAYDLMQASPLSPGERVSIPGEATMIFEGETMDKASGFPRTIELVLSFGSGVAGTLIAEWLLGKIKGRATTLRIERREVQIEKGEIKRVVEETIEQTQ